MIESSPATCFIDTALKAGLVQCDVFVLVPVSESDVSSLWVPLSFQVPKLNYIPVCKKLLVLYCSWNSMRQHATLAK